MAFEITRLDGRSNARVLLDHLQRGEPGQTYTFDELANVLSEGTDRTYSRIEVRRITAATYDRLLAEQQRALHNVRGIGYRLAPAGEHNRLAMDRKKRADVQLERGVNTLRNVRWDELDPESRKAHEGTLLVMSALHQQQVSMERRQRKIEETIRRLSKGKPKDGAE